MIQAERRRKVAALRVRGMTLREITRALPLGENPVLNLETGRPFNQATVQRDVKELEAQWKAEAVEDIGVLKGRHLAELAEVRRVAWAQGQLYFVLESLKQTASILGLNAVQGVPYGADVNVNIANFDLGRLSDSELARLGEIIDTAGPSGVEGGEPPRAIEAG